MNADIFFDIIRFVPKKNLLKFRLINKFFNRIIYKTFKIPSTIPKLIIVLNRKNFELIIKTKQKKAISYYIKWENNQFIRYNIFKFNYKQNIILSNKANIN